MYKAENKSGVPYRLHAAICSYFSGISARLPDEQVHVADRINDLAYAGEYDKAHYLTIKYRICPTQYASSSAFPINQFRVHVQRKINHIENKEERNEQAAQDALKSLTESFNYEAYRSAVKKLRKGGLLTRKERVAFRGYAFMKALQASLESPTTVTGRMKRLRKAAGIGLGQRMGFSSGTGVFGPSPKYASAQSLWEKSEFTNRIVELIAAIKNRTSDKNISKNLTEELIALDKAPLFFKEKTEAIRDFLEKNKSTLSWINYDDFAQSIKKNMIRDAQFLVQNNIEDWKRHEQILQSKGASSEVLFNERQIFYDKTRALIDKVAAPSYITDTASDEDQEKTKKLLTNLHEIYDPDASAQYKQEFIEPGKKLTNDDTTDILAAAEEYRERKQLPQFSDQEYNGMKAYLTSQYATYARQTATPSLSGFATHLQQLVKNPANEADQEKIATLSNAVGSYLILSPEKISSKDPMIAKQEATKKRQEAAKKWKDADPYGYELHVQEKLAETRRSRDEDLALQEQIRQEEEDAGKIRAEEAKKRAEAELRSKKLAEANPAQDPESEDDEFSGLNVTSENPKQELITSSDAVHSGIDTIANLLRKEGPGSYQKIAGLHGEYQQALAERADAFDKFQDQWFKDNDGLRISDVREWNRRKNAAFAAERKSLLAGLRKYGPAIHSIWQSHERNKSATDDSRKFFVPTARGGEYLKEFPYATREEKLTNSEQIAEIIKKIAPINDDDAFARHIDEIREQALRLGLNTQSRNKFFKELQAIGSSKDKSLEEKKEALESCLKDKIQTRTRLVPISGPDAYLKTPQYNALLDAQENAQLRILAIRDALEANQKVFDKNGHNIKFDWDRVDPGSASGQPPIKIKGGTTPHNYADRIISGYIGDSYTTNPAWSAGSIGGYSDFESDKVLERIAREYKAKGDPIDKDTIEDLLGEDYVPLISEPRAKWQKDNPLGKDDSALLDSLDVQTGGKPDPKTVVHGIKINAASGEDIQSYTQRMLGELRRAISDHALATRRINLVQSANSRRTKRTPDARYAASTDAETPGFGAIDTGSGRESDLIEGTGGFVRNRPALTGQASSTRLVIGVNSEIEKRQGEYDRILGRISAKAVESEVGQSILKKNGFTDQEITELPRIIDRLSRRNPALLQNILTGTTDAQKMDAKNTVGEKSAKSWAMLTKFLPHHDEILKEYEEQFKGSSKLSRNGFLTVGEKKDDKSLPKTPGEEKEEEYVKFSPDTPEHRRLDAIANEISDLRDLASRHYAPEVELRRNLEKIRALQKLTQDADQARGGQTEDSSRYARHLEMLARGYEIALNDQLPAAYQGSDTPEGRAFAEAGRARTFRDVGTGPAGKTRLEYATANADEKTKRQEFLKGRLEEIRDELAHRLAHYQQDLPFGAGFRKEKSLQNERRIDQLSQEYRRIYVKLFPPSREQLAETRRREDVIRGIMRTEQQKEADRVSGDPGSGRIKGERLLSRQNDPSIRGSMLPRDPDGEVPTGYREEYFRTPDGGYREDGWTKGTRHSAWAITAGEHYGAILDHLLDHYSDPTEHAQLMGIADDEASKMAKDETDYHVRNLAPINDNQGFVRYIDKLSSRVASLGLNNPSRKKFAKELETILSSKDKSLEEKKQALGKCLGENTPAFIRTNYDKLATAIEDGNFENAHQIVRTIQDLMPKRKIQKNKKDLISEDVLSFDSEDVLSSDQAANKYLLGLMPSLREAANSVTTPKAEPMLGRGSTSLEEAFKTYEVLRASIRGRVNLDEWRKVDRAFDQARAAQKSGDESQARSQYEAAMQMMLELNPEAEKIIRGSSNNKDLFYKRYSDIAVKIKQNIDQSGTHDHERIHADIQNLVHDISQEKILQFLKQNTYSDKEAYETLDKFNEWQIKNPGTVPPDDIFSRRFADKRSMEALKRGVLDAYTFDLFSPEEQKTGTKEVILKDKFGKPEKTIFFPSVAKEYAEMDGEWDPTKLLRLMKKKKDTVYSEEPTPLVPDDGTDFSKHYATVSQSGSYRGIKQLFYDPGIQRAKASGRFKQQAPTISQGSSINTGSITPRQYIDNRVENLDEGKKALNTKYAESLKARNQSLDTVVEKIAKYNAGGTVSDSSPIRKFNTQLRQLHQAGEYDKIYTFLNTPQLSKIFSKAKDFLSDIQVELSNAREHHGISIQTMHDVHQLDTSKKGIQDIFRSTETDPANKPTQYHFDMAHQILRDPMLKTIEDRHGDLDLQGKLGHQGASANEPGSSDLRSFEQFPTHLFAQQEGEAKENPLTVINRMRRPDITPRVVAAEKTSGQSIRDRTMAGLVAQNAVQEGRRAFVDQQRNIHGITPALWEAATSAAERTKRSIEKGEQAEAQRKGNEQLTALQQETARQVGGKVAASTDFDKNFESASKTTVQKLGPGSDAAKNHVHIAQFHRDRWARVVDATHPQYDPGIGNPDVGALRTKVKEGLMHIANGDHARGHEALSSIIRPPEPKNEKKLSKTEALAAKHAQIVADNGIGKVHFNPAETRKLTAGIDESPWSDRHTEAAVAHNDAGTFTKMERSFLQYPISLKKSLPKIPHQSFETVPFPFRLGWFR